MRLTLGARHRHGRRRRWVIYTIICPLSFSSMKVGGYSRLAHPLRHLVQAARCPVNDSVHPADDPFRAGQRRTDIYYGILPATRDMPASLNRGEASGEPATSSSCGKLTASRSNPPSAMNKEVDGITRCRPRLHPPARAPDARRAVNIVETCGYKPSRQ